MALVAENVIDLAREFHPDFMPEAHPSSVCLSALRRAERRFFHQVALIAPNAVALDHVFDATEIASALDGAALTPPSFRMLLPTAILANESGLFSVTISEEESSGGTNPTQIRMVGRSLYIEQPTAFQGEMDASMLADMKDQSHFKDADGLRITYVPSPDGSLALADSLTAPDDAEDFLVGDLVRFLVGRTPAMGPERQEMMAMAMQMQADVLAMYQNRSAAETRWFVTDAV